MRHYISILAAILIFGFAQAQDIQYVSAENGLVVREKPNRGAARVGLLDYGTAIEITQHTNLQMDVMDNGEKLSGEWVKIRGIDAYEFFDEGYVFNGFLTEEKLERRFAVRYDEFSVSIEGISKKETVETEDIDNSNILIFSLNDGESLEGKTIRVKHHQEFRTIEVFQKHENSIAISDNNSHCDLLEWEHFYSSWKPLKVVSNNRRFKTQTYSGKDTNRFIDVDIEALKAQVTDACGESWGASIKDVQSIKDKPIRVTMSKIMLKVVMTDIDGYKTEKIIIFEIPMNC